MLHTPTTARTDSLLTQTCFFFFLPTYLTPGLQGGSKMFGPRMGVSSKNLPSNKVLKTRAEGQDDAVEVANRDLKRELLERETKHYKNKPDLLAAKQLKVRPPWGSNPGPLAPR